MAQVQNDTYRFPGPHMIQDHDHMAEIPQVKYDATDRAWQARQSQLETRKKGSTEPRSRNFNYENPREYH